MDKQTSDRLGELESKVSPFDLFEALRWGVDTPRGKRFIELYRQACELRGDTFQNNADGTLTRLSYGKAE